MNIEQKIKQELNELNKYTGERCIEWLNLKKLRDEHKKGSKLWKENNFKMEGIRWDIDYCRAQIHILEKLIKGE